MVMPEEVKPGAHGRKHLVDLGLAGIGTTSARKRTERLRRLVAHEDVDAAKRLARLDLIADEMTAFVVSNAWATRGLKPPGCGRRELRCGCVVPRRRECASESCYPQPIHQPIHPWGLHPWGPTFRSGQPPIRNVMEIRREISRGDSVEVVVVAVDPVDGSADGFIPAGFVGDVADAQPERNLGMAGDDRPRRIERAVDVA
jgi:hypothetical protein